MSNSATGAKKKFGNAGFWLGIGLLIGLSFGFSNGAASGGEFAPTWAWNLISFGLGAVAALLLQWALGRDG